MVAFGTEADLPQAARVGSCECKSLRIFLWISLHDDKSIARSRLDTKNAVLGGCVLSHQKKSLKLSKSGNALGPLGHIPSLLAMLAAVNTPAARDTP
jgi:hypothetical protein